MSKNLDEILGAADWKELTPRLLYYGDNLIRRCIWRGLAVTSRPGGKVCVEGVGADDLLQEAVDRLLNGRRTYNHSGSLELNLRGAIKSIVWSLNKSSLRRPLIDITGTSNLDKNTDPIDQLPGSTLSAEALIIADERAQEQKRRLEEFEKSLIGENDLVTILDSYKAGYLKPSEIERHTKISASRVSELKRKLRDRMDKFEAKFACRQDN